MLTFPYQEALLRWVKSFTEKTLKPGLCCISFYPTGLAAALVVRQPNVLPELKWCKFIPYPSPNDIAGALAKLVKEFALENTTCSWLLQPKDYNLITTEPLAVNVSEMHDALRWQVKDFVGFHAEEIILDYFESPVTAVRGKKNSLEVVVANQKYLMKMAELINASGLALQYIDIAELALRNITSLFPEDKKGLGLVWFRPKGSSLIITQQKALYLRRNIEQPLDALFNFRENDESVKLTQEEQLKNLTLEIQRSLDYYQGQLRQALPAKLLITLYQQDFFDFLAKQLILPLEILDMKGVLTYPAETMSPDLLIRNLDIIGGALRLE